MAKKQIRWSPSRCPEPCPQVGNSDRREPGRTDHPVKRAERDLQSAIPKPKIAGSRPVVRFRQALANAGFLLSRQKGPRKVLNRPGRCPAAGPAQLPGGHAVR